MATVDYTALHKIARVFEIAIEDLVEIDEKGWTVRSRFINHLSCIENGLATNLVQAVGN
jgi:hypothetical protein